MALKSWTYHSSCCSAKMFLILVAGNLAWHCGHSWTFSIHSEQRIWPFSHWYKGPALGVSKQTGHSKALFKTATETAGSASVVSLWIYPDLKFQNVNIRVNIGVITK